MDEIKKILAEISKKLNLHSSQLVEMNQKFGEMNQKMDEMRETLDSHTGALMRVESVLEGYGDMYKINKGNIIRHEKRITKIEDRLDINPNPELVVIE